MENMFLKEATRGAGTALTDNGAISYASTGKNLLDQFAKSGTARNRDLTTVFAEQSFLWAEDNLTALRFPFYLRMVTRKTHLFDGNTTETVQRGQGAKDEALKRMLWLAYYQPDYFYKNLWLVPIVGSWKDLWTLMYMDNDGYLKKEEFYKVIAEGINDTYHKELVKKYLPRIRSNHKCITTWAKKTNNLAKSFASFVGWNAKQYRIFKSSGIAHEFQQYICQGLYNKLDFKKIPGRALSLMLKDGGKFLQRHNLYNSYIEWIKTQPVAKFTGYVYELGMQCPTNRTYGPQLSLAQKLTIDKQFDGLIKLAKTDNGGIKGNVWALLDTSGSMNQEVRGTKAKCCDIATSLAVYFATLNEGAFHKSVLAFDNTSHLHKLSGTFTEMLMNLPSVGCGGTNFQGAIDEIIKIRKSNPNIPLTDYPKTLLAISDMQFNKSNNNMETNYESMKRKLYEAFPKDFVDDMKFIWWHVTNSYKDFPSTIDHPGTYNFSGFDGAIISLLLGGEDTIDEETGKVISPSMEDLVNKALTQEVLLQINM